MVRILLDILTVGFFFNMLMVEFLFNQHTGPNRSIKCILVLIIDNIDKILFLNDGLGKFPFGILKFPVTLGPDFIDLVDMSSDFIPKFIANMLFAG